jgi:16S rRNA (adenine1518-N6/adenine1519-N6)-dimethyltransferase
MVFAKKSLGQNFLISPRIVGAISDAGEIQEGESVLEIGPGKGVLTRELLLKGAHVKAVEKDDRLIPILSEEFKKELSAQKLSLIHGDILEMSEDEIAKICGDDYKVIANIPYYITGAILRNLLSSLHKPKLMILMVQKEVASRIIARDGKESILSLSVKAYAKPELVMNVSRGNFFPIPNVDSAVLKISDIKNSFDSKESEKRYFDYVKAGFSQKRKKLISNLESLDSKDVLLEKFKLLGISLNARAEDIELSKWIRLAA